MIKTWLLRIIASILLLVIGLIFTAPAELIVRLLPSKSGISLHGVSGRLLSGEALQLDYAGKSLQQLTWELSLTSLITGKLGSDITVDDPAFNGALFLEKGFNDTLSVSEINATQIVSTLAEYYRPLKLLNPEGKLYLENVSLSMDEKTIHQAGGTISWKGASLSVNNNHLALGNINIIISDKEGELLLTISDENSHLDVSGTIKIGLNRRYDLQLSLTDDLPANIKSPVLMVARPDGKGRLKLNTKGSF